MLFFLVDSLLIGANRREVYRTLGLAGMGLAILMAPLMYAVSFGQISRANQPPGITALAFIVPFSILVWRGWTHRRDAPAHKRLMLSAAFLLMNPAVGRLPVAPPTPLGMGGVTLVYTLCFIPLSFGTGGRSGGCIGRRSWALLLRGGGRLLHLHVADRLVGPDRGASARRVTLNGAG